MTDQTFRGFIERLGTERPDDLLTIDEPVNPRYRIQALVTELERRGRFPALRFPRVEGYRVELPEERLSARFDDDSTLELTPDLVGRIQLVGPDGPRPLTNLTIVRTVGCLKAQPNETWALMDASAPRPVRARIVNGTTPEELQASAAQPLGTQTFPLLSVTAQGASLAGHKVQVKGVLNRQNKVERINVMSLDSVAPACGG